MEFNSDKFELLRFRLRGSTVQDSAGYKSNIGFEIEEKAHVKDLGVKLSSAATFSGHIGDKVASVKTKNQIGVAHFRNSGTSTYPSLMESANTLTSTTVVSSGIPVKLAISKR